VPCRSKTRLLRVHKPPDRELPDSSPCVVRIAQRITILCQFDGLIDSSARTSGLILTYLRGHPYEHTSATPADDNPSAGPWRNRAPGRCQRDSTVPIVARDPERSLFGKGSQCYATICERPTAVVGVLRSGPDRARCRDLHPCRVVLRRAGCLRRRGRRKRGRWWRSRARSTRHSAAPATDRARFNNGTDLAATRGGTWLALEARGSLPEIWHPLGRSLPSLPVGPRKYRRNLPRQNASDLRQTAPSLKRWWKCELPR
jgi:hypothetical protein